MTDDKRTSNAQHSIANSVETIAAQASPSGRGGIGIVRVSGSLAQTILTQITQISCPPARQAVYASFYNEAGEVIDAGIILFFQGPHSFTGEDVVEFQGHGGPVVIQCLLKRIVQLGARLARPGEFSERAFLNDKLDLIQAEAIADLIDSASEQAAKSAMRSLQGDFSKCINSLVTKLIYLRTYVEAAIDFPEEEVDFLTDGVVLQQLNDLIDELKNVLDVASHGARLREGLSVVIAGKPNAGKSSLLNQLTGRDSAIVTEIEGTTRDVIREQILLEGIPLHIIDTAGLRDSGDPVEQEGIRRARLEIDKADLLLLIVDITTISDFNKEQLLVEYGLEGRPAIIVFNKIDLIQRQPEVNNAESISQVFLSAKQGVGIELLREHLIQKVGIKSHTEGQFIARERHLIALKASLALLLEAKEAFNFHKMGELLAEDLRRAQQLLGEITGQFTADDLLGTIFASFCIGK